MVLFDKVKEFAKKFKEENAGVAKAMKRINSSGFCGNINRGVNDGDFWNGSYISIEDGKGVIYGSNQEDYFFSGNDIESFELVADTRCTVSQGNNSIPANRFIITFKDGKRAQADIIAGKLTNFKSALNL